MGLFTLRPTSAAEIAPLVTVRPQPIAEFIGTDVYDPARHPIPPSEFHAAFYLEKTIKGIKRDVPSERMGHIFGPFDEEDVVVVQLPLPKRLSPSKTDPNYETVFTDRDGSPSELPFEIFCRDAIAKVVFNYTQGFQG